MMHMRVKKNILKKLDEENSLDFKCILKAVEAALESDTRDVLEAALRAANAMPQDASDFDRGLAAGFALANLVNKADAD